MSNMVKSGLMIIMIGCTSLMNANEKDYLPPGKNTNGGDVDSLRHDGVYALYDTALSLNSDRKWSEIHNIYSPLIVVNHQNAIFLNYLNFVDSSVLRIETYKAQGNDFSKYVGTYYVVNDTIFATLPTSLMMVGERRKLILANYRGIIKNRDTIINWQLVPPYPKVNKKHNNDLELLRMPHLLYFVESKELSGLDFYMRKE